MGETVGAAGWVAAITIDALAIGDSAAIEAAGQSVLICRASDGFYAVANRCSHAAMPLAGGRIRGHHLSCPVHGARFDLRTGAAGPPAQNPIPTFPTRIQGIQVFVRV